MHAYIQAAHVPVLVGFLRPSVCVYVCVCVCVPVLVGFLRPFTFPGVGADAEHKFSKSQ